MMNTVNDDECTMIKYIHNHHNNNNHNNYNDYNYHNNKKTILMYKNGI